MEQKLWIDVAKTSVKAGPIPFPITESLVELFKILLTEEEARFIVQVFKKKSMNKDQIKQKVDLDEESIDQMLGSLMQKDVVTETRSRSTGVVVYTFMPPFPGLFEFTLMKGDKGEREQKLAVVFEKIFKELRDGTQRNYDTILPLLEQFPAVARVVPIEQEVEVPEEIVLLPEEVSKIVDNSDAIALTHCYCRQERDILNDPCKYTDKREICLLLGKVAEFSAKQGLARFISKDEAKAILKDAEADGLVHKIFHNNMDLEKNVDGICSCCKCCCGIFRLFRMGAMPFHTHTSYLAKVDECACAGCGTCAEKCHMDAIEVVNDVATVDDKKCIGCGACVTFCPQEAVSLERTGPRDVLILPVRKD